MSSAALTVVNRERIAAVLLILTGLATSCRLGLPRAAARVKRAIQFGSRLSKQTNVRDFGSNRAANIHKAGGLRLEKVAQGAFGPGAKWQPKPKH